jgi:glutaminyl-tRNA synthetase
MMRGPERAPLQRHAGRTLQVRLPISMSTDFDHAAAPAAPVDFIRAIVDQDIATGKHGGRVATRFPPEPNGYLHIGHAKSICLNFGVAQEHGGTCNLRFDDTNPVKEDVEYVDAIKDDVAWLGFRWTEELYASDYFERLYECARTLIRLGLAYVDSLSADEVRQYRGTLTEPGKNSPYRNRSVDENLELFARMRAGEFEDGAHVLRAKIDMSSPNLNMRDPTLYRIRHASHHRTGDAWCIYPMYDFAHPLSDAFERITHSLCTLEYEDHRPLYDWLVENLIDGDRPQQIEFARLNLNYTVMSKRKLLQLVQQGFVSGWDDPRMPTIAGLRRRGYTPESIRDFCARIGVAKKENVIDVAQLEHSVREDLNRRAPRVMGVLRPLKVVVTNYPDERVEELDVINNPEDPSAGTRKVPFSRVLYIEREDFREDPPKKFFRLSPGKEVRLRCAYFITCTNVVKNSAGEIVEVHCTYDPATRGGDSPDGRRVKATLHWVSAAHAVGAEVRLYDRLFSSEDPERMAPGQTFLDNLNPNSLEVVRECRLEPGLASAAPGARVQFERLGYFCVDPDSRPGALVFNRTVSLRDTWAKIEQRTATETQRHRDV